MYIVIGDVHGCLDELRQLIEKINPSSNDKLVFLGDLVDKGPQSAAVVSYVAFLMATFPGSAAICGNHEEVALRAHDKGKETEADQLDEAGWAFLQSLPLIHRFNGSMIAVHGGLMPGFFRDHPEGIGEVPANWHRGGGKKGERMRRFLRLRNVTSAGDFVALGQDEGCSHWSDSYEGQEGFAFYGHDPVERVKVSTHAVGLDTGCVFGGRLTAAIVPEGGSKFDVQFTHITARQQYAARRGEEE